MNEKTIESLIFFSDIDLQKEFFEKDLPVKLSCNKKEDIGEERVDLFIGDILGYENCLDWMNENKIYPAKVILLIEGFHPREHLKKETILIENIDVLVDEKFWQECYFENNFVRNDVEVYTFGLNSLFNIGGIIDEVGFHLQSKKHSSLEVYNSLFKIGQFVSSLYLNESIKKPVLIKLYEIEGSDEIDIELDIEHEKLDPIFLLDYLLIESSKYEETLLMDACLYANFSQVTFSKAKLQIVLKFSKTNSSGVLQLKIDKIVKSLEKFVDPENLTTEKSGVLLGLSRDKSMEGINHPGILHKPKINKKRKESIEDLAVRVLGQKESYSDKFDIEKVKSIINEDASIKGVPFSDEELERVVDISNDVESTVILARAKEDMFTQVVAANQVENEIANVIDSFDEDELPMLIVGKGEINLEEDGSVVVSEAEKVEINEKQIIVGAKKFKKDDLIQKVKTLSSRIKDEALKVKGGLKNKIDVENFVLRITEREAPELKEFGLKISQNIISGFLSDRMNNIVKSNDDWGKINEMIKSYQKKIEQKDKQISSLSTALETLKFQKSEMHPVFKEMVKKETTNNEDSSKTNDFERIVKRKNQYIKKLEAKLIDQQQGEMRIIGSDNEDQVKTNIIIRKDNEDHSYFSDSDDNKETDINISTNRKYGQKKEIEKFKNIGRSMAKKLEEQNSILGDYKARNFELLTDRNNLQKEKNRLRLRERQLKSQALDLENKLQNMEKEIDELTSGQVEDKTNRESLIQKSYERKVEKLELLNEKLSEGAKSLAKKLTHLQIEHTKIKNENRSLSSQLRRSIGELEKYKKSIRDQLSKRKKAS